MIARYNRRQITLAVLAVIGGLACYGLAWLFFRYLPPFIADALGPPWPQKTCVLVASACLAVITFSGWRTWKAGRGLHGYHESALYHDLGEETAGAIVVDHYAQQVTAPAYLLSQLFLAGPLLLLRARTLWASLLPATKDWETRVTHALTVLQSAARWQSITEHPSMRTEILYLAQMGQIEFSAYKGTPRIKACPPHHGT